MAWLPDGEKISKISLFVLMQLTNVTDTQTDRRTDTASHRAAKTMYQYCSKKLDQSTAVITAVISTCPDRAGPVFSFDAAALVYFATSALRYTAIFAQNHDLRIAVL